MIGWKKRYSQCIISLSDKNVQDACVDLCEKVLSDKNKSAIVGFNGISSFYRTIDDLKDPMYVVYNFTLIENSFGISIRGIANMYISIDRQDSNTILVRIIT